ncbi:MAG: amino acid adenylation domain-containing protein, partial [Actinomycetota bacterium]|nr:amino acid adenylation domain-containing protein [Actinomycetota bacterium]
ALPVPGPVVLMDRATPPTAPVRLPQVTPHTLAYVSHTSGSTGTPNAVLVEHRGLRSYLCAIGADNGLGPGTVALQVAPIGYDASIRDLFAPLVAGGCVVVVPRAAVLRPDEFADTVRAFGVNTLLSVTPSFLGFMTGHEAAAAALRTVELIVSSGESLLPFLMSGGRNLLPGRLVNQYGPTECTMTSTRYPVPAEPVRAVDLIGTAIDGVSVWLLGPDLRPVPDGVTGEVHIGGVGVARGYGGRPALTAERFVPDPFGPPGARLYRTGDLARRHADGNLVYLGRADRQLKIRGYRVDPAEIEGALLSHPAVTGAALTATGDERGRVALTAHVAGRLADVPDTALRAHLARSLPPYMMPRRFVRIASVPTTHSGKTDRNLLSQHDENGTR